jgi:UDP-N-acetylmuramate--alanine ligase
VPELDLSSQRRVHIVGIGGAGMNAIASVLLAMGHVVTGSDARDSAVLQRLRSAGASVWTSEHPQPLPAEVEALAKSTAVPESDAEVSEAERRGLPVLHRADLLSSIAALRKTIGVAGTHGKTTTSTLLALVLEAGGVRPSWIVGGEIAGRDGGGHWDSGAYLVVEADESDGTFLRLGAQGVIVTNVEPDHLEFYGRLDDRQGAIDALHRAFDQFVENASGPRVVCVDDEGARRLAERHDDVITYGTADGAQYQIVDAKLDRFDAHFNIKHGSELTPVHLPTAGLHNVRNATAALAMGDALGVPLPVGAVGLENYGGVNRRFQRRGEKAGVTFVDEYAHLPGEVKQALAAARAGNWPRIVAVFQPHRYSRTQQVGNDFGGAFDDSDLLILTDVFGAGEPVRTGIDGHIVENAVVAARPQCQVVYVEDRNSLAKHVAAQLQPGDLCITLGAGDITKLPDEIMAELGGVTAE